MAMYQVTGTILIEGTLEEAAYDFDMEWDEEGEPGEMDVLNYMMDTGVIQILHRSSEEIDDEEDE